MRRPPGHLGPERHREDGYISRRVVVHVSGLRACPRPLSAPAEPAFVQSGGRNITFELRRTWAVSITRATEKRRYGGPATPIAVVSHLSSIRRNTLLLCI